jgi:hypothetical protein
LYLALACWFCLPSLGFLLAPALHKLGDAGSALALLTVLTSLWVGPVFTVFAMGLAITGHCAWKQHKRERFMWGLLAVAVLANLFLIFTGGARFLPYS